MRQALDALSEIRFMPYFVGEDVWRQDALHVEGLHPEAWNQVKNLYSHLRQGRSVANVVIEGRPGVGKTHFLGRLRAEVMERGDFFVLAQLSCTRQFWPSLVISYLSAFFRQNRSGKSQLSTWSASLLETAGLSRDQCDRAERSEMSPAEIVSLRSALRRLLGPAPEARKALDVAIALMLQSCDDFNAQDVGEAFLQGLDVEPDDQRRYGFRVASLPPREVIMAFDELIAQAGKVSVVSVDQLDGLISITSPDAPNGGGDGLLLDQIANGLMDLAQDNRRSLIVLSCLRASWQRIKHQAVQSAAARYPVDLQFSGIPTPQVGEALIATYFKRDLDRVGYRSPYPTWPIKGEAFRDAHLYTPRALLQLAEAHIRKCLQTGKIIELQSFGNGDEPKRPSGAPATLPGPTEIPPEIEVTFESARKRANIGDALDEKRVDSALPDLLRAGLAAWIEENSGEGDFSIDPPPGKNPPLHARLRKVLDPETEAEAHWAFRAVQNQSAVAALNRLRAAVETSGLGLAKRKLIILRNSMWSSGPKTSAVLEECDRLGACTLPIERADLAVFSALRGLHQTHGEASIPWLRSARPASATKLFQAVLNESVPAMLPAAPTCNRAKPAIRLAPLGTRADREPSIPLGTAIENGQWVSLKLEDLRRHAAIFAGSGSGKTVLIRRIIEECALQGVSTIILDPNNDLSRLGTPWPEVPRSWAEGDAEKARRYFSETEVLIWTPRRATGRPLSFRPLADLSAVMADPDEFSIAIDNAVGTIFPRAGLPTAGGKAEQGRAVLNEALRQFVSQGGDGLNEFLKFLSALPEGVSRLANAQKLASDMAQTLIAATVNDPLFGGEGEVVDPGVLLTPKAGKNARISVISLIGLPNDDQRQSFVNQLQMSLFAWAKKNPAGDRPLGGLFVMDEAQTFAPSGPATPCTGSTLALVSQARKYGLGLIFATQAPKGLHNRIPGNATTQFYGFLNAPAQITAAREMAAAKGGDISDISRLTTGQFYIVSDCIALQKVSTPLCLSYHPKSPLTQQEILDLARD